MTEVAIVGCGPAGLLAAHAVAIAGHAPVLYSKKAEMSPNARGVFLHRPVPGITSGVERQTISLVAVGSRYTYAEKVYGREDAPTSWDKYANRAVSGWPIASAYLRLWDLYSPLVREAEIGPEEAVALDWSYPLVINTAPAYALCKVRPWHRDVDGVHLFPSRRIWVRHEAPVGLPNNTMMYNGRSQDPWCRASRLFGVGATEYGSPQPNAHEGIKVGPTTCDCNPRIHRAGRWGTWKPGVLLHHAYETAKELCDALQ
jgi:hypothetical protein